MSDSADDAAGALHIDVISDVVCPWCFIGKRQLDLALRHWESEFPDRAVAVRWHPFFLNPDTPEAGEPYRPFLERKFGGPERLRQIWDQVSRAGHATGIAFAFEKIELRANTLSAHRLIHYAQAHDISTGNGTRVGAGATASMTTGTIDTRTKNTVTSQLVEAIFAAQFLDGWHIGDKSVLTELAAGCGLDRNEVARYLNSDEDATTVKNTAHRAQQMGIGGVPFFILNGAKALSGAQGADTLLQAMREAPLVPAGAAHKT